jgi:hypothetical protein
MRLPIRRAGRAALVFAAALTASAAAAPLVYAEQGRVFPVQSEADLKKRADALLKGITGSGGKVTYGAVEKGAKDGGLVIKNLEITAPDGKKVTIEQLEVRGFDWDNAEQPMHVDFGIKKLVVPAEALDKEAAELGITSLTINADFDYRFDDAKKTFEISGIVVDIVELGELRLKLKLVGLSLADIKKATGEKPKGEKKDDDAGMKLLANVNLSGATISFKDKSLVERLIRSEAKKKNMTEAAAKAKMLEDLAEQRKKAEDDATRELIDLATKFLTTPGTIEIVANPAQPANVMMAFMAVMSSPATLKQLLGLSIAVK